MSVVARKPLVDLVARDESESWLYLLSHAGNRVLVLCLRRVLLKTMAFSSQSSSRGSFCERSAILLAC